MSESSYKDLIGNYITFTDPNVPVIERINVTVLDEGEFNIKKVIFNDPATIVMWADGTKTVVKCQDGDIYDKRTGLLLCMAKKMYGNKNKFNDILNKWCPEEEPIRMNDVIDYIIGETPKIVGKTNLKLVNRYIFGGNANA